MTKDNKNYKILCIEDEADVRDNITEILKDEGFQVIEANDGVDGYEKFITENPHVIISDIMMPKMSGYELLKKIRSTKRKGCNYNVPFIFLSALSQKEDIIKGTNLSANDYMIKPVDLDILVAKVKEKIRTLTSIEQDYKDNLDNLCLQVSNILSNDAEEQVGTLLKIISILKTRPYGPFGHRKYDDMIDKLYMIAVKLESVVKNSVQPDSIVDKINIEENIIDPEKFVNNLISSATKNINRKITLISSQGDVPNIKVNSQILRNVLESLLVKMLKVTNTNEDLKFDLFVDYNGKLAFAIHGNLRDDVKEEFIENTLNIEMELKELEKQNGLLEKEIKNNKAIMLVNLPGYRFVKK
jgi:CheY-like chemotaxis protein